MYRCDLPTGKLTLDTENPGDVLGWGTEDESFEVPRAACGGRWVWEARCSRVFPQHALLHQHRCAVHLDVINFQRKQRAVKVGD